MKPKPFSCGLEAALKLAGGKWRALVLWNLFDGPRRFGELRRSLPGISEKMLIQTLRSMQDDGIVARKDFQEIPPRVAYSLTPFGKSLTQVLKPLCEWGTKHMLKIAVKTARSERIAAGR
jgi:DNA-binding HxlR family transcriptional regulator